jgi:type II secretory pathway pseudopilin PulG
MTARAVQKRSQRGGRGYTAVEVMLAMAVLMISAAGVMSMQKGAIQGNLDARRLDVANAIARTWLDRLETDASTWNEYTALNATILLKTLAPSGVGQGSFAWTPLSQLYATYGWSDAFDIFGRDVAEGDSTGVFCTRIEVDTMAVDSSSNPTLLRATVMVFWPTALAGAPAPTACPGPTGTGGVTGSLPGTYHTVFVTEGLRRPS